VLLLERSGWASLGTEWSPDDWIRSPGQEIVIAFIPQVVLFGLAALPPLRGAAKA
jgi:hypothetical protein